MTGGIPNTIEKIFSYIHVGLATECWPWTRSGTRDGYGEARYQGRKQYVHRLVYEDTHGPIQPGNQVNHLCVNPSCNNPHHLEEATIAQNANYILPGVSRCMAGRTHCPYGHPLSGTNLKINSNGGRACRICHKEEGERRKARDPVLFRAQVAARMRAWRARKKQEAVS